MEDKAKHNDTYMPDEQTFKSRLSGRQLRGHIWQTFYLLSILVAILALIVLFMNVINSAFGAIATTFEVNPSELVAEGQTLANLSPEELTAIIVEREPNRLPVLVREYVSSVPDGEFPDATLREVAPNGDYPDGFAEMTINDIRDMENTPEILGEFMRMNLSRSELLFIIEEDIVVLQVVDAWPLWDAIFNYEPSAAEQARLDALPQTISTLEDEIASIETQISDLEAEADALHEDDATTNTSAMREINDEISLLQDQVEMLETDLENTQDELTSLINSNIVTDRDANFPEATLVRYQSWVDSRFLVDPMSSVPAQAGIRTALIGSMMMMSIVILVSLPVGVATAIYLEEYARDNFLAKIPQAVERRLHHVPLPHWLKRRIIGLTNINQLIETNVRNLAGVPSIIYGMLGLAIFVRVLAPFTSGVAFGINTNPPPPDRIVDSMEEPDSLGIDILLDDNYSITMYTGPEFMTRNDAQEVVRLLRRFGTRSINNRGGMTAEQSEQEIAAVFDMTILPELPTNADPTLYAEVEAGFIELAATPMSIEQFQALAQQLRRITAFTLNGRTILSGALTLSLLILPVIIINSQEALRAVPNELREASYGLGATKWQTIWRTVLPASVPGIMTGTILAVSRAVGETAPLIVVGASTFLLTDPSGAFSQFTVLPIQIFQWSSRPQGQFQFIAAAAIIVLLTLVLALNAIAIVIRNRFSMRD